MKKIAHLLLLIVCIVHSPLFAQDNNVLFKEPEKSDYKDLIDSGNYEAAAEKISQLITEINSKNSSDKRIPSSFVSFASIEEEVDLTRLFNERTVENFLLEVNPTLHTLHKDAAFVYHKLKDYNRSITHNYQALRYKVIEKNVDDRLFVQLAETYREINNPVAYRNSLEIAHRLNGTSTEYTKALGESFYRTKDKQKAIYYFENYLNQMSNEIEEKEIFIKVGNLYTGMHKSLKAEEYYTLYIEKGGENPKAYSMLGDIAFKDTGNFDLAKQCYQEALKRLPEDETLLRSKAIEHIGDIDFKRVEYQSALDSFLQCITYENSYRNERTKKEEEMKALEETMNALKRELLKKNDYIKYKEYQVQKYEYERLALEKSAIEYELRKYTSGLRRWKVAESYERLGNLKEAIEYYRLAVTFNYKPNKARQKIKKLELKINRGY